MFKSFVDDLINKKLSSKQIVYLISKEFSISDREAHTRIRSLYGKKLKELLVPSKEEVVKALLVSESVDDMKEILGVTSGLGVLYEKYFKVSTFSSAKIKAHSYRHVENINPSREDNFSILISQRLGDGCYYFDGRSSLRIVHSFKQLDYLYFKVGVISKCFPALDGVGKIKIRTHTQGHKYCSWEGTLKNSFMEKIKNTKAKDLVKHLTPFGILLLYLDDGSLVLTNNGSTRKLSICNGDSEVLIELQKLFKSYGLNFSYAEKDKAIKLTDTVSILSFLDTFVLPFKHLIPDQMEYKTKLMI